MKRTSRVAVCTSQLGDSALTRVASGTTAVRAIASLWQSSTAQFDDHSASIPALRRPSRIRSRLSRARGSLLGLLKRALYAFHAVIVLSRALEGSAR